MNSYERLFKLWTMVCKMIMDGKRSVEQVADLLQTVVDGKAQEVNKYLRRLFTFKLGSMDGTGTYSEAKKLFRAGFDPEFKNQGIVFSGVAPETMVAIDQLIQDGLFSEFLGVTVMELEKRRLLGSQFLAICKNCNKLRKNFYDNFFVLTRGDELVAEDLSNVFIANVFVDDGGGLGSDLYAFSDEDIWDEKGCPRIFSPER